MRAGGDSPRRVVRWAAAALFGGLLVWNIHLHGPLTLAAPRTPFTNAEPGERAAEPYLLFLRAIG